MISTEAITQDKKHGKLAVACVGIALISSLAIGTSIAYLTDQATIQNELSLDTNLRVELTEPSFVKADSQDLVPTQVVPKDPTITNIGTVDEYIAATVKVPIFSGTVLGDDGASKAVINEDLFSYELGDGWSLLGQPSEADGFRTYTYVYADELTSGKSATPLFNQIVVANLTADAGIRETSVEVCGHAIQSYGFDDASSAYQAYLNQNAKGVSSSDVA